MRHSVWMFIALLLYVVRGQTTGMFLQAISAALATIPLTGGPIAMTAGLAGLKLAVGSKLLYFLGYFGRRQSVPKPSPLTTIPFGQEGKPSLPVRGPFPGYSAVPLPYIYGPGGGVRGGFGQQLGIAPQGFPQSYAGQQFGGAGPQFSASQLAQTYGGMQGPGQGQYLADAYGAFPGGYASQGYYPQPDFPNSAVGGFNSPPFPFEMNEGHEVNEESSAGAGISAHEVQEETVQQNPDKQDRPSSDANDADVDSFFSFLSEMDDNKCISRLICDIGADPQFLGEFSQNIDNIISSLEVPTDSRAHHYVSIMHQGRSDKGGCAERFAHCTDDAYEIVKSVAPSVGVPSNLEDLNLS